MSCKWCCLLTIPLLGLALMLTSVQAKQKPDPDDPIDDPQATAVEQIATAYKLVEFGRSNKAPEALITAGGLLRQIPPPKPSEATLEVEGDTPKNTDAPTEKAKTLKEEAEDLFAEALVMASKDQRDAVQKLVNAIKERPEPKREPGTRGSLGGPKVINRVLPPKGTHNWNIKFIGGQPAVVTFRAALTCRISWHGPAGGVIGKDDCMIGRAAWMPGKNGAHTIRVHNLSPRPVAYSLYTN